MTLPTLYVEIDFSNGPSFGYPFILDSLAFGILDTNVLADSPADLVDISSQVRRVSTRRGRNRILNQFEAGTATVVLNDPNGDFNPQNPSSPYYGKLLPLRKIRIYAGSEYLGNEVLTNIFAGYITSYDTSFFQGTTTESLVTLQCVDGFRLLNNVSTGTAPVPGATSGQLSGTRIDTLLSFAGFPDSMMALTPGQSQMQVDPGQNRTILQACQTIEQSEFGGFFMGRSGKAIFLDRNEIAQRSDVVAREYSDVFPLGPNVYPYSNIDFAYDDQLILNDVTVSTLGGPSYTEEDATSIATYFTKSGQRLDLLMLDPIEAQDQALTLLAARKDADLRIDSMTLDMNASISELNTLQNLSMDIYTLINVTKTMPGATTITKEVFAQGVNHDITPGRWIVTVFTSEPLIQAFILDSTNQGVLDTNILTY